MKYKANPVVVDAFEIVEVWYSSGLEPILELELENGKRRKPTPQMLSRIEPSIGDYWVIQSEGYEYLNPKEVFLRKYSPLEVE